MSCLEFIVRRWSANLRLLPASVFRSVPGTRPRLALECAIERLEGRVVPSTILVTSLADSGRGTLRSAIEKADRGPHHLLGQMHLNNIKFSPGIKGTSISLTSALPVLSTHIAIIWPSRSRGPVSPLTVARSRTPGTPTFSIFTVAKGAVVAMANLQISNGNAPQGGGIVNAGSLSLFNTLINANSAVGDNGLEVPALGGGIENTGNLTVEDCDFTNNSATDSAILYGYAGYGGAIANSGTLSITNSKFSMNSATGGSGRSGANGGGGAIENSGTLSITGPSQFFGNSAEGGTDFDGGGGVGFGGAIMNSGAASITDSAFAGNVAEGSEESLGGGIYNTGTASVSSTYFEGNTATNQGDIGPYDNYGYGGGIDNSGTLSVTNAYFLGNSAASYLITGDASTAQNNYGGGINNSGILSVTNATFVRNSAAGVDDSSGGAIANSVFVSIAYITADDNSAATGGGVAMSGPPSLLGSRIDSVVESIDSIYHNTQGGNFAVAPGSFQSLGNNLFSDDPDVSQAPTDLVNTDPLLGPLTDNNGGNTETEALLEGSPAKSAGIAVPGVTTDQRGAPRPSSGATDIGAFQTQPPLSVMRVQQSGANHLVLNFNLPLDPSRAQSLANYSLIHSGGNRRPVSIRSAQYDSASHSVTLRLKTKLSPKQSYVLTAIGTGPGGLTTTMGAYLAAANIGEPGSNFVVELL